MGTFVIKGGQKSPGSGRQKGVRNRVSMACLNDALENYQKNGKAAWEILFHERPADYIKCIVALMPGELGITSNNILAELPDDQLELIVQYVTRLISGGLEDRIEADEGKSYRGGALRIN
jgi:hypothetical protein